MRPALRTSTVKFLRVSPSDPDAHDNLAEALIDQQELNAAAAEFQAALKLKPDEPRAHTGLGNILLGQGHPEEAIVELKKATVAERTIPFTYQLLARAYASLHRYDDAIQAWMEVKKSVFLSTEASLNIGTLLIEQKRYADAIAELQPAAEKRPNDARLQFVLARGLLRAGDVEKSMTAFQKTVELNPTPAMLNSVSYELAEANVHLDDALGYAHMAVTQQEDKAAGINLGNLTRADLQMMPALAAEWDTLGWVHYRLGHMDEAEKFISAAWKLAQFPNIGNHLGLVYEKMGKLEEAIRVYKMTLATRQAPVETSDRLTALLGSKPTDEIINGAVEGLMQLRTIKLPRLVKGKAEAEFFVIFTPGSGVTGMKFISGSDELRSAGGALASAHYDLPSPDNHPVRFVRRGIVDCASVGASCEFVLLPPESVSSVN
jgi:tetratricopeptide (TPR) repeat protein